MAGEAAAELASRLAWWKAAAAARNVKGEALVLGADTVVEAGEIVLGKPRDAEHAREMLRKLSGGEHRVFTGMALLRLPDGEVRKAVEQTTVLFKPLEEKEIEDYVATGEPFGKAGGYAIQGLAAKFVGRIDGEYWNVVGLPIRRLQELIREMDSAMSAGEKAEL